MRLIQEKIRPSVDTVTIGYEEYNRKKARIEMLEILAESEEDVNHNRVAPIGNSFTDLRTVLK